jgi:hypothetical protein
MTTQRATGGFEITSEDQPYDEGEGARLSRSNATKTFHGDLAGSSTVQLIKAVAGVPGSAGYVGIERVEGTLNGRSGSFVLQHSGMMERGEASLSVLVVPDTGTGQLEGIRGGMEISVEDGAHRFSFDYSIE